MKIQQKSHVSTVTDIYTARSIEVRQNKKEKYQVILFFIGD